MMKMSLSAFKKRCEEYGFSKYRYRKLESDCDGIPHIDIDLLFKKMIVTLRPNTVSLYNDKSYISFGGIKDIFMENVNTYYLACQYSDEIVPVYYKISCEK